MIRVFLSELTTWPNLLSLSRIPLGFLGLLALRQESDTYGFGAILVCLAAALTDWLDGVLARRATQVTPFGVAVDPIADKLFAAIMVVGLILYRDFPLWLALVVVGRDILIVVSGYWLMQRYKVSLPSNLFGKYAFASLLMLILSEVIRFPFGIQLFFPVTIVMLVLSFLSYATVGLRLVQSRMLPAETDSPIWLVVRVAVSSALMTWYVIELWRFLRS
jgi:CDP-diacylglycerol--glycerol-3-phosphate 3-phosphatidyltransferase